MLGAVFKKYFRPSLTTGRVLLLPQQKPQTVRRAEDSPSGYLWWEAQYAFFVLLIWNSQHVIQ